MFTWKQIKSKAVEIKQRRHIQKLQACKSPSLEVSDKAFATKFAGDLKILESNKPLILKRIKEETEAIQLIHEQRVEKLS